ncbi:SpoIIE family protein phosphatase [Actinoplanes sp. CA-030573]|uniref:SpoIIE family protein phosphatase n=1 Tax=Actinoplanes sp. CA-030573 TaxID=3239898 RepID=UPI003D91AE40
MAGAYAEAVGSLRPSVRPPLASETDRATVERSETDRATVERAVGLLAGRARCRLAEARRHLLRMAADQQRDVLEVAHGLVRALDVAESSDVPRLDVLTAPVAAVPVAPARRFEPWLAVVQRVLDVTPGMCGYLVAERDHGGRIVDLIWQAATPEACTPDGSRGARLVGRRVSVQLPGSAASGRWDIYQDVLDTGSPAAIGPFRYGDGRYTIRAHRLGVGLLLHWTRHDGTGREAGRMAGTERLGNLGWGEWDLVTGDVFWSEHLYRIFDRDPRLGPMSRAESDALTVPDDAPLVLEALEAFDRETRVDVTTRVRIGSRVKHLRTVAEAVRDASGRPLRVYGIVQDVTDRENDARRLAEVERQLADEHELAGHLQRIIQPVPEGPIELPGVKVALRYLPAGQESLVGGDWYQATQLRDGTVLLAVGDVAGHGTPAATTMAQLRHALRALAVTTSDPGVLLGQLNRLTCDLERDNPELSATAVVARFDPARQEITWAQAGHPPPLLNRGGRTMPLERPPGPILGVVDDAVYPTARMGFHPGDVLLLYTDGLVEHRRRGLDDGLAQVMRTVDEAVAASPEQPLAQLLARLRRANPDDDTCILAARPVTGETRDLRRHLRGRRTAR